MKVGIVVPVRLGQEYIDNYCKEHGLPTFRPTI